MIKDVGRWPQLTKSLGHPRYERLLTDNAKKVLAVHKKEWGEAMAPSYIEIMRGEEEELIRSTQKSD